MIRRKDGMEPVTRHELQKGMGDVTLHTFMAKEEVYGSGRTFAHVMFEPGMSIGIHEHHGEFEGYYILKGQAPVTDNGAEIVLSPGDHCMCKDGDSHDIGCYGDETMEIIALIINVPV